jgi:hypothetical protein
VPALPFRIRLLAHPCQQLISERDHSTRRLVRPAALENEVDEPAERGAPPLPRLLSAGLALLGPGGSFRTMDEAQACWTPGAVRRGAAAVPSAGASPDAVTANRPPRQGTGGPDAPPPITVPRRPPCSSRVRVKFLRRGLARWIRPRNALSARLLRHANVCSGRAWTGAGTAVTSLPTAVPRLRKTLTRTRSSPCPAGRARTPPTRPAQPRLPATPHVLQDAAHAGRRRRLAGATGLLAELEVTGASAG